MPTEASRGPHPASQRPLAADTGHGGGQTGTAAQRARASFDPGMAKFNDIADSAAVSDGEASEGSAGTQSDSQVEWEVMPLLACWEGGRKTASAAASRQERSRSRNSEASDNFSAPSSPEPSGDEASECGLESRPTTLSLDQDIYDAVVAAAFGGVSMEVDKADKIRVAPGFLAFFWVPLFAVQFALALFLCLDMDLDSPIRTGHEDEDMEISTQLLLVVIVNISFFHQMLDALKNLALVLNPITWVRVEHMGSHGWGSWAAYVLATVPCTAIAVLAKLAMLYWISSLSTSVILACPDVKDSIFNCLAISFIVQLGESTWRFACDSFHLQLDVNNDGLQVRRVKRCRWLCITWKGRGRVENLFAVVVLFAVYTWHFIVVAVALDTNILPVARDVCQQWRWLSHGHGRPPGADGVIGMLLRWIALGLVGFIRDPQADVNRKADPTQGGVCNEDYSTISLHEGRLAIARHLRAFRLFLVLLFSLLVLPTVLRKCRIWKCLKKVPIPVQADDAAAVARRLRAKARGLERRLRVRGAVC